jgi:CRP/FNR family cyclic AMP-dependent transcriptional regulator
MLSIVEKVLLLKQVDLFSRLTGEDLAIVAEGTVQQHYRAGETLMAEEDVDDFMCCIIQGNASIQVGNREVARVGAGETCGEMSVFETEQRSATVIALTDLMVLEISHCVFNALIEDRPEIARGVIGTLARRLRDMNRKLGQHNGTGVPEDRVANGVAPTSTTTSPGPK